MAAELARELRAVVRLMHQRRHQFAEAGIVADDDDALGIARGERVPDALGRGVIERVLEARLQREVLQPVLGRLARALGVETSASVGFSPASSIAAPASAASRRPRPVSPRASSLSASWARTALACRNRIRVRMRAESALLRAQCAMAALRGTPARVIRIAHGFADDRSRHPRRRRQGLAVRTSAPRASSG